MLKYSIHFHTSSQQIRKNEDVPFMPMPVEDPSRPGHYKSYHNMTHEEKKQPTDDTIPSVLGNQSVVTEQLQGCSPRMFTKTNARLTIDCMECGKPRVLYSSQALSRSQTTSFKRWLANNDIKKIYTCGMILEVPGIDLFLKAALTCVSPIETSYYTCNIRVGIDKTKCCFCSETGASNTPEERANYSTVLPACEECRKSGKKPRLWGRRHGLTDSKRRKIANRKA